MELTQTFVQELFLINSETGDSIWKPRKLHHFKETPARTREHQMNWWNKRFAGKPCGFKDKSDGYYRVKIGKQRFLLHRVIWLYEYGYMPEGFLDHINGRRDDNRICNLREVTPEENCRNAKIRTDNVSGFQGVLLHKRDKKWYVAIGVNGKNKHVGVYDSFEEAVSARKAAEVEHGYFQNHGRSN